MGEGGVETEIFPRKGVPIHSYGRSDNFPKSSWKHLLVGGRCPLAPPPLATPLMDAEFYHCEAGPE